MPSWSFSDTTARRQQDDLLLDPDDDPSSGTVAGDGVAYSVYDDDKHHEGRTDGGGEEDEDVDVFLRLHNNECCQGGRPPQWCSSLGLGSFAAYPKAIKYIIGNEFCERFSYYGMRAVLVLYFINYLQWTSDQATVWYHFFILLCYFTSIFGAILADSSFGKFKTILCLSIVYCLGSVVMALTAIPGATAGDPPDPWGAYLGMLLIGIGTGGM